MKKSTWFNFTLAAALCAGGLFIPRVYGADLPHAGGHELLHRQLLEQAKERLGLTDEQVAQIHTVLKADKDELVSLLSRLHETHEALRNAIHAPDASEAVVRAAAAELATVEADLAVERMKLYGKISPVLRPEQREKLKAFHTRMDDLVDSVISRIGEHLAE